MKEEQTSTPWSSLGPYQDEVSIVDDDNGLLSGVVQVR